MGRPEWSAVHLTLVLEGAQAVAETRSVPDLGRQLMALTEEILDLAWPAAPA